MDWMIDTPLTDKNIEGDPYTISSNSLLAQYPCHLFVAMGST
jgi:hypothetical protein